MTWSPASLLRQIEAALSGSEARAADVAPVIWLIGKTGAGKTSIVAALTGDERAVIGEGYRPATSTAFFYDVPEGAPVLRFLDTKGLGESGYDPAGDIAWCEESAHILLCVLRLSDPAQEEVLRCLRQIRRRHPSWPLVVAQTGLHDLYPKNRNHPESYFYTGGEGDLCHPEAPAALAQAMRWQRERLADLPGKPPVFVPVDLTRAEDGYVPAGFGAEALAEALVTAGAGVIAALRLTAHLDPIRRRARRLILRFVLAAGVSGALPAPGAAIPSVALALAAMLKALAGCYGLVLTRRMLRDFIGCVGSGAGLYWLLFRRLGTEFLKLVPGAGTALGGTLNAAGAAGLTYALGEAACAYFGAVKKGRQPQAADVQAAFRKALAEGITRARGADVGMRR